MHQHDFAAELPSLRAQLSRVRGNYHRFWEHYLDRFAANEKFHHLGESISDDSIATALRRAAGARLHSDHVHMVGLVLREIASVGLVHGACFLNGRFCTFLASRQERSGLMAMASLEDGGVVYSRFTMGPRAAAAAA